MSPLMPWALVKISCENSMLYRISQLQIESRLTTRAWRSGALIFAALGNDALYSNENLYSIDKLSEIEFSPELPTKILQLPTQDLAL
jgi:hypothetical protein